MIHSYLNKRVNKMKLENKEYKTFTVAHKHKRNYEHLSNTPTLSAVP